MGCFEELGAKGAGSWKRRMPKSRSVEEPVSRQDTRGWVSKAECRNRAPGGRERRGAYIVLVGLPRAALEG